MTLLRSRPVLPTRDGLDINEFESLLDQLCERLTAEIRGGRIFSESKAFENRVRGAIDSMLKESGLSVDFATHPYGFPDIPLGEYGIEVKFTTNDTWRSVANSVFEGFRDKRVRHIYVVFGKMGGIPEVRWGRYEDCVMHVRTSHVPRFEVEMGIGAEESLFRKFGITYEEFSRLNEEGRMAHIRNYAKGRLAKGERLWWLEEKPDEGHALPLRVKLYANLDEAEKMRMRAEASLICPRVVSSRGDNSKYTDAIMYLLTYRSVLISRDTFSAGSATGQKQWGRPEDRQREHVKRALIMVQAQMAAAAHYLEDRLFVEYWGESVLPGERIKAWLKLADGYAQYASPPWKPSDFLFLDLPEAR